MPASLTKIVNSIRIPKPQKNAKPSKDELKLEFITYENQQKGSELSLELIYDERAATKKSSAFEEQVLNLEQQQAKMQEQKNSSKDAELMRGFATGLQTRQLEAFRKHVEKTTVGEQEKAVEMLRGATGLQRTQIEALKKQAERQAEEQQQKSSPISSNPTRSRL